MVEGDVVAEGEAAGVVDAGVGGLSLEDGEEGEDHEGQTYVYGRRCEQALRIHVPTERRCGE